MKRGNTKRTAALKSGSMDLVTALRAHGRDAVSFQAVEPGIRAWHDDEGVVAYCDTGSAWVAVGSPLAAPDAVARVAERFVGAARAAGKRAVFFACDDAFDESAIVIGEQPWWRVRDWPSVLRANRRLREQLRRARKKGVVVRAVSPSELARGTKLKGEVDALAETWLAHRPMQPMHFLVTLAMFEHAPEHRYYEARRDGALVAFASVVPIYARAAFMLEDLVREPHTPNGTTELLFNCAMRDLPDDAEITWGLAPLANAPWPMRAVGALARGLYDFRGLRAFKARLHPRAWQKVFMIAPGRNAIVSLYDVLRAFAGGSLVRFGVGTLVRRPFALAWVLTLLLVPWTAMLVVLLAFHRAAAMFGFPRSELFAWAVFDALFAAALVRAFWKPRVGVYGVLACAAALDAIVSIMHLTHAGFGASALSALARTASAVAPTLAALGLTRCATATFVSK